MTLALIATIMIISPVVREGKKYMAVDVQQKEIKRMSETQCRFVFLENVLLTFFDLSALCKVSIKRK